MNSVAKTKQVFDRSNVTAYPPDKTSKSLYKTKPLPKRLRTEQIAYKAQLLNDYRSGRALRRNGILSSVEFTITGAMISPIFSAV
jgi:hypothetical protein